MAITWAQALAWRLRRHLLDPVGDGSAVDVVRRLGWTPAWPDRVAELAVACRRGEGRLGDAGAALEAGELVKSYTFRGGTHLMTPQDAGAYLAVRASSRMWELASWQRHYGLTPEDWPPFRDFVRDALGDGPLTREELVASFGRSPRWRHLRELLAGGNDTLLKPLTWQGDMVFGPPRESEATFQHPDAVPGWAGLPAVEEAGPAVVAAYLRVHGPVSTDQVHDRVGKGLGAKRKAVAGWLRTVAPATVAVGDDEVLVLPEDVDELATTEPSASVRLVPSRDPWVMAPGSGDVHVVPPAHRDVVGRLAHLVLHGGVVAGTWRLRDDTVTVDPFAGGSAVPRADLEAEVARLGRALERELTLAGD